MHGAGGLNASQIMPAPELGSNLHMKCCGCAASDMSDGGLGTSKQQVWQSPKKSSSLKPEDFASATGNETSSFMTLPQTATKLYTGVRSLQSVASRAKDAGQARASGLRWQDAYSDAIVRDSRSSRAVLPYALGFDQQHEGQSQGPLAIYFWSHDRHRGLIWQQWRMH